VEVVENKKREVKVVKMIRHLKQDAYHESQPVESLTFNTLEDIRCLRTALGDMIGLGMANVPAINQNKYLGENYNCFLVLCSKSYLEESMHQKHLQDVGFRFMWDGLTIGVRVDNHRGIYSSVLTVDWIANNITTLNERVTNSQIEMTEGRQLVPIVPGMTRFNMSGVLYKVTSILDPDNTRNTPPNNVTESRVHSLILSVHGGTTVRSPIGASRALNMIKQRLSKITSPVSNSLCFMFNILE
jgi:hypothetical protein